MNFYAGSIPVRGSIFNSKGLTMNKKAAEQQEVTEICVKEEEYGQEDFNPCTWLNGWEAAEKFYGIKRNMPISRHQGIFSSQG